MLRPSCTKDGKVPLLRFSRSGCARCAVVVCVCGGGSRTRSASTVTTSPLPPSLLSTASFNCCAVPKGKASFESTPPPPTHTLPKTSLDLGPATASTAVMSLVSLMWTSENPSRRACVNLRIVGGIRDAERVCVCVCVCVWRVGR